MVLDPVTALAVAGNIVQFVDFSFKLVSKANEFHEHGSLLQHQHLRQYAQQIKDFNSLLETRLKGFQDEAADKAQDPVTRLLRLALDYCNESAAELLDATKQLTVSGSNSRWQSFRHALSSIMGENGLQMTTQRLSQAQQNVVLFLVLYTR
jgi:N-terminal domain on NACHT_NTPase and P-loop NTPases